MRGFGNSSLNEGYIVYCDLLDFVIFTGERIKEILCKSKITLLLKISFRVGILL